MKKYYPALDIGKLFFACAIPFLHIPFEKTFAIFLIRNYIARLGVPFFFAVSGAFLWSSIQKHGTKGAFTHYAGRVGKMLGIWLIIYLPLMISKNNLEPNPIQRILFLTPGFLWYLTALLFASVFFCGIQNRKNLYILSAFLYIAGTLLGGSYSWLTGGWPAYEAIFLTTRNGLFFALPMMCVGEICIENTEKIRHRWALFGISILLLYIEITFIQTKVSKTADTSMYLMLPFTIAGLLFLLCNIKCSKNFSSLRSLSSAIYVVQFGVINIVLRFFSEIGFVHSYDTWIAYFSVIVAAVGLTFLSRVWPKASLLI